MQVRLFTIPITDEGSEQSELNKFLGSHKVIELSEQFVSNERGAYWCFCVKYIASPSKISEQFGHKGKDYKSELDGNTFRIFTVLREVRKGIAAEDKIPAYAICTDEELAAMAKLSSISKAGLLSVKGFGEKKMERFGERLLERWRNFEQNEKGG
jgi:superfamily II DNA helicase RecQ